MRSTFASPSRQGGQSCGSKGRNGTLLAQEFSLGNGMNLLFPVLLRDQRVFGLRLKQATRLKRFVHAGQDRQRAVLHRLGL